MEDILLLSITFLLNTVLVLSSPVAPAPGDVSVADEGADMYVS